MGQSRHSNAVPRFAHGPRAEQALVFSAMTTSLCGRSLYARERLRHIALFTFDALPETTRCVASQAGLRWLSPSLWSP
jgi:hypothetical protein